MKIRILTNCYPPEIGACANQLFELAQEFTRRGHAVSVVTRFPRHLPKEIMPNSNGQWITKEQRPEARIIRISIPQLSRKIPLLREIEHILNFLLLVYGIIISGKSDVTLIYSPPIVVGYAGMFARLFVGGKVVLNVQDLFPQSLIDLGLLRNKPLIVVSRFLEKFLYQKVDHITVMSEGNKTIVEKTAGSKNKTTVIYNWVDVKFIKPGNRENEFRKEYGLGEKFVFSFAGCIADSQDMDIIINTAKRLKNNESILFLIAGNGPKYEETISKVRDQYLNNIKVIPIQPREKYVKLLAASDVGLITLNPSVATPVVPSKMLSIMSAGRPILASLPIFGDAPKFIERSSSGLVVKAGDLDAFYNAVILLSGDFEKCKKYGEQGRKFVVANYSLETCAEKYEELFSCLLTENK